MSRARPAEPQIPAGYVGAHVVRMETGAQFVRLCLPRDAHGPLLPREEIARLRALLDAAEAQLDTLPDDSGRHVVPVEI
ncbi:hypothetical protein C8N35_11514 [Breoghania corrubedonensis]|uniref:Uncharacterized protein n=1 Tax=Breoghania corrubedonensis TaxID=665038 RepID=A0A2T5UQV7_9HYPH|nr:hypothetical protein [Breoghania corrubedonensis]PTW53894.1 hypothetical protein C8N35_11514 [Breoghania corrubedonensis]